MKHFIFINILWCVFVVSFMSCRRILLVNFTSTDLSTKKFIVDSGIIFKTYQDIKDYIKLKLVLLSDDVTFNIEVLNSQRGLYESVSLSSYFVWESGFLSILISNVLFNNNSTSNSQRLAIKGRLFDINTNFLTIQKHVIRINEGISTAHLGTGLNTWDCSIVLAKYLESNRYLIEAKQVLELGSGTGIAGIAALILQSRFVRLTDLKYTISNLLSNVEFNVDSHQNESCLKSNLENSTAAPSVKKRYVVSELDWGDGQTFPRDENGVLEQYDVILGADIVWLEHLIPSLIYALKTIMNDSSMFIFAYQVSYRLDYYLIFLSQSTHFNNNKIIILINLSLI